MSSILNQPEDIQQDEFEKTQVFKNIKTMSAFANPLNFLKFTSDTKVNAPIYCLSFNPTIRLNKGNKPNTVDIYSIAKNPPQILKSFNAYKNPQDTPEALMAASLFMLENNPKTKQSIMLNVATEMLKCSLSLIARENAMKEWMDAINKSGNISAAAQAYGAGCSISLLGEIVNSIVDDKRYDNNKGFTEALKSMSEALTSLNDDPRYTPEDRTDAANLYNITLGGIINFAHHPAVQDILQMAEEQKAIFAQLAGSEIDSKNEQHTNG